MQILTSEEYITNGPLRKYDMKRCIRNLSIWNSTHVFEDG